VILLTAQKHIVMKRIQGFIERGALMTFLAKPNRFGPKLGSRAQDRAAKSFAAQDCFWDSRAPGNSKRTNQALIDLALALMSLRD